MINLKINHRFKFCLAGFLFALSLSCPIGLAEANQERGLQYYKKQDYKNALIQFQTILKSNPNDYDALYYSAIIFHRVGATEQAEKAYGRIIQLYPDSAAAKNSAAALAYLDPKYLHRIQNLDAPKSQSKSQSTQALVAQPTSGPSADYNQLPNESQVYFEPAGNNLLIDASINNRPLKMLFDTGASTIAIGKNHLRELGIPAPQGPSTTNVSGVGAGGAQKAWQMIATVKVGQIERKNIPITVQEDMPTLPLLGQTFFNDFYYSIERSGGDGSGRGVIRFRKKSAAKTAANDPSAVPFIRVGNELIVSAQVNGRPIQMFFDTGADGCVFTERQLKQLGVEIPENAQEQMSLGIAGHSRARAFTVDRMKLGPIEKQNVQVSVVDDTQIPYPLLGQTFFGDLRYEIDNDARVIRLRR